MTQNNIVARSKHDGRAFEIVSDRPELGFYLFVYEGDKCIYDYVLNSMELCKEFGELRFGVPVNAWQDLK